MTDPPPVGTDISCGDQQRVNPEVAVDVQNGGGWARIPVTEVEMWANKDGPADITRTAKVHFPAEWNDNPVSSYVDGFTPGGGGGDGYDKARVWFYDTNSDSWDIAHYGYVGSVGAGADEGVLVLWIYDVADLLRGISTSVTWENADVSTIASWAIGGIDARTVEVGLNQRSIFQADFTANRLGEGGGESEIPDRFIAATADVAEQGEIPNSKRFQANRHNMVDVLNWAMKNTSGKWYFDPQPDGVVLTLDYTEDVSAALFENVHGRPFVEETEDVGTTVPFTDVDVTAGRKVTTLENTALNDIKPINTLEYNGKSVSLESVTPGISVGSSSPSTARYPYVKVIHTGLLERAGGYEYGPKPVEGDAKSLKSAANNAVTEFREHFQERTQGDVIIRGKPEIRPWDTITTVPACNGIYPNADLDPITYEVNEVRHRRAADEPYKTELGVSLHFSQSQLEIEQEYRKP